MRLSTFMAARAVLILTVILVSLSFSMASFVVPTLASGMLRAASWVFGPTAVSTVAETQQLRKQNQTLQQSIRHLSQTSDQQAKANQLLTTDNQRLTADSQRLNTENRRLTTDNQRLTAHNKQFSDQLTDYRRVTASTARRIGQRAVRSSTLSIAAIPLESVPVLGITTIIATTAWEIRETCATLDDMAQIQRQLDQEPDNSFAAQTCDKVPLQAVRVSHYGNMHISECRADANAARARVFELADQARETVPDLVVDENTFEAEIVQAANEEFEMINVICDCIEDLLCDPEEFAR